MCQSLERLKGTLLSLSAGTRRLSDREEGERTVADLHVQYDQHVQEAKDKQSALESLLSHWQKSVYLFQYTLILSFVNINMSIIVP